VDVGGGGAHCRSDGADGVVDSRQNRKRKGSSSVSQIHSRCPRPSMGLGYDYVDGCDVGCGYGAGGSDESDRE
jgi:hypothetical protein